MNKPFRLFKSFVEKIIDYLEYVLTVVYHLLPGRLPEEISIICPKILYHLPENFVSWKSVSFARSILCHLQMIQNFRANDTTIFGQTPWGQTRIDRFNPNPIPPPISSYSMSISV